MRKIFHPLTMLAAGLAIGAAVKLLDYYTQNIGNMFSQLPVWVLIGTVIAVFSPTKWRAMPNVFLFCAGMLLTYYLTAWATGGVFGWDFIMGWSVVALVSPVLGWVVWHAREPGVWGKVISGGILAFTLLSALLLEGKLRVYDLLILAVLIWVLFGAKVRRGADSAK